MNHERLYETESRLVTRIGKAFLTERVVMHGKDLHHELDHLEATVDSTEEERLVS